MIIVKIACVLYNHVSDFLWFSEKEKKSFSIMRSRQFPSDVGLAKSTVGKTPPPIYQVIQLYSCMQATCRLALLYAQKKEQIMIVKPMHIVIPRHILKGNQLLKLNPSSEMICVWNLLDVPAKAKKIREKIALSISFPEINVPLNFITAGSFRAFTLESLWQAFNLGFCICKTEF